MNKYLLLRDNKQSGPYTVPEIIAMGIKPYDLVWLEGKSAAWRYPSEIEELKAHAPAVEEQPFDRFYKKPDTQKAAPVASYADTHQSSLQVPAEHKRFEPPVEPNPLPPTEKTQRKVYINFPGSAQPAAKTTVVAPASTPIQKDTTAPALKTPPRYPERQVADTGFHDQLPAHSSSYPVKEAAAPAPPAKNNKLLYGAIAACLVLIVFSVVLLMNYRQQQKSLRELNSIVQQLEQKAPAETAALPVKQEAAMPPPEITPAATDYNEAPVVETSRPTAVAPRPKSVRNEAAIITDESPVTFTEKNNSQNNSDDTEENIAPVISSENLFKLVAVKPNNYKTGLLGGISNLRFELSNNSAVELHKVAVEVRYLGPEKKVVKKQMVYFENISPGAQATIDVPKSNRGVTIEYTVTDIKS